MGGFEEDSTVAANRHRCRAVFAAKAFMRIGVVCAVLRRRSSQSHVAALAPFFTPPVAKPPEVTKPRVSAVSHKLHSVIDDEPRRVGATVKDANSESQVGRLCRSENEAELAKTLD